MKNLYLRKINWQHAAAGFTVAAIAIATFFLVYSPHQNYPYPFHIDEWHHISQSKRLIEGDYMNSHYASGFAVIEMGFHLFLLPISKVVDLVLFYKYLPGIWAAITSLVLFIVVRLKTKNFFIAIFAMMFFASLKSNVNILGLWFFTPLTFSLPFVYLYTYFISEGILQQNKKYIIAGLSIMVMLVPVYATAVLFAVPALFLYAYYFREHIKDKWNIFWVFLAVPLTGIYFYKHTLDLEWGEVIGHLQQSLQFGYGWGVLELNNSPSEAYSWIGYGFAIVGFLFLIFAKKYKEYLLYLLWPITIIISIEIFKETGVSLLAPYQRNFYYLAVGMPILSAFGLYFLIRQLGKYFDNFRNALGYYSKVTLCIILILVSVIFTFRDYYNVPKDLDLYQVINEKDYQSLVFLKKFEQANVIAPIFISSALYAISGHNPFADIYFVGEKKEIAEVFYSENNCEFRQAVIAHQSLDYVVSPILLDCGWPLVYSNGDYVYQVDSIRTE